MTNSDISDITWDMMSDAGIDIGLVKREHTETGNDIYVLISGDTKVAFGPSRGERGNAASGWDIAIYLSEKDDQGPYWAQYGQDWAQTPKGTLRLVAAAPT